MRRSGSAIARRTTRVRGNVTRTQIAPTTAIAEMTCAPAPAPTRVPCTPSGLPALLALHKRDRDLNEERRQQHPGKQSPVASAWPIDHERGDHREGRAQKHEVDDGPEQLGSVHRCRGECAESQSDQKAKRPHCLLRKPTSAQEGGGERSPGKEHVDERRRRRKQSELGECPERQGRNNGRGDPSSRRCSQGAGRRGDKGQAQRRLRIRDDQVADRYGEADDDERHRGAGDQHRRAAPAAASYVVVEEASDGLAMPYAAAAFARSADGMPVEGLLRAHHWVGSAQRHRQDSRSREAERVLAALRDRTQRRVVPSAWASATTNERIVAETWKEKSICLRHRVPEVVAGATQGMKVTRSRRPSSATSARSRPWSGPLPITVRDQSGDRAIAAKCERAPLPGDESAGEERDRLRAGACVVGLVLSRLGQGRVGSDDDT